MYAISMWRGAPRLTQIKAVCVCVCLCVCVCVCVLVVRESPGIMWGAASWRVQFVNVSLSRSSLTPSANYRVQRCEHKHTDTPQPWHTHTHTHLGHFPVNLNSFFPGTLCLYILGLFFMCFVFVLLYMGSKSLKLLVRFFFQQVCIIDIYNVTKDLYFK